jgi:hypothetical protein
MKCPTRYFYQIVLGYRTKSSSVHLDFGSMVHKGLEFYWKCRSLGDLHDEAQATMTRGLIEEYGTWKTDDTAKNFWNALRACVWHTEAFQHDDTYTVNGTAAIELAFKYDLGFDILGEPAAYCGHMDKVVVDNVDSIWVKDYKTTKNAIGQDYFAGYTPSTQLPGYLVAAEIVFHLPVAGVLVDAIQCGVNFTRFGKGYIVLGESQRDEWMKDAVYHIQQATRIFANNPELDPLKVPRNTEACFGCPYRAVCGSPPSIRIGHLSAKFEQVFWDPILRKEAE